MKVLGVLLSHIHTQEVVLNIGVLPGLFSLVVQRNPFSSSLSHKHLYQSKEKPSAYYHCHK